MRLILKGILTFSLLFPIRQGLESEQFQGYTFSVTSGQSEICFIRLSIDVVILNFDYLSQNLKFWFLIKMGKK